jgi:hypothetical protein
MTNTEIAYTPLPTMLEFHKHPGRIRCIVGPVGSGKTTAAAWELCYYLPMRLKGKYGIKSTRWLILRNTYPELIDTTQKTVFQWFPWGDYKVQRKDYILKYPDHGVTVEILFRSCDNPKDVRHFKSLELTGYWIDESIEVSGDVKLMLVNRIGRYPTKCPESYGIQTTNPPDIEDTTYHQFEWVTDVPGPLPTKKPLEDHFGFWQPPNENNDNLPARYYEKLILAYADNPDWAARYVRGEPGITVKGKSVYNNFTRKLHVATEPLVYNGNGRLYAGWDNTGNCPACVVACVPSPGIIHILREYHTERMGIVDFCNYVVADRNDIWPDADWVEWGDPAGEAKFSRSGGGLTSNAELMRNEARIALRRSEQNWEARRESVEYQLGRLVSGEPGMLIDPSCIRLINGFMGGYCYPEIGVSGRYRDKPEKNKFSHIHDALQYMCVMLLRNVSKNDIMHERMMIQPEEEASY